VRRQPAIALCRRILARHRGPDRAAYHEQFDLDIFRDLENANLGFSVGAETSARSGLDHANSGTAFTWDEIGIEDLKGKMIEARDLLRIGVRTSGM
jgi:hypothetical protein